MPVLEKHYSSERIHLDQQHYKIRMQKTYLSAITAALTMLYT